MAPNPPTNLRLPPDVRQWLRTTAATKDITLTELVARMVREYMDEDEARTSSELVVFSADARKGGARRSPAPRAAADEGGYPPCPGCGVPRNPDPGEYALHDAMAHAQCDQNLQKLEEEAQS